MEGVIGSKTSKVIGSKYFLNHDCSYKYTIKINGTCAYRIECRTCYVVYKVNWKLCDLLCIGNTKNTLKRLKIQNMDQKLH